MRKYATVAVCVYSLTFRVFRLNLVRDNANEYRSLLYFEKCERASHNCGIAVYRNSAACTSIATEASQSSLPRMDICRSLFADVIHGGIAGRMPPPRARARRCSRISQRKPTLKHRICMQLP